MTDLEYDVHMSLEWAPTPWEDSEVDCEETAKNLTKLGYQKIVWHDTKKELPERNKCVLGYSTSDNTFVVVKCEAIKRGYVGWFNENEVHYNVDYWAELPEIKLEQ